VSQLKVLRNRIGSVRSTRKITSAMKMVAAARLRRAQNAAVDARAHVESVRASMRSLAHERKSLQQPHPLIDCPSQGAHVVICMTSARGLCGSFNANILRTAKKVILAKGEQKASVWVLCVGNKGYQSLSAMARLYPFMAVEKIGGDKDTPEEASQALEARLRDIMANKGLGSVQLIFAEFRSAIAQVVTSHVLVPLDDGAQEDDESVTSLKRDGVHLIEADEDSVFDDFAFYSIRRRCYHALLETLASEHGARMTAMDSATRNAGDMMSKLTLQYNRRRQAMITRELIEIISGAEAL